MLLTDTLTSCQNVADIAIASSVRTFVMAQTTPSLNLVGSTYLIIAEPVTIATVPPLNLMKHRLELFLL